MASSEVTLIYPHQLFEQHPGLQTGRDVYLVEDPLYFSQFAFHKQKLILHRASMKQYQLWLEQQGDRVVYFDNEDLVSVKDKLVKSLVAAQVATVFVCELVDDWVEQRLIAGLTGQNIKLKVLATPGFLSEIEWIHRVFEERERYYFTEFYVQQRKRLNILLDSDSAGSSMNVRPVGGRWTFDTENRKKLKKGVVVPATRFTPHNSELAKSAQQYVVDNYPESIGSSDDFFYPINFEQAEEWLDSFLVQRFALFGDYEDAISKDHDVVFHSVLTPALNIGLLTPEVIVKRTLDFAREFKVPLNSLEGFIRQVIGWREYVRAIYEVIGRKQRLSNFWGHTRSLPQSYYDGTTGIAPFDTIVKRLFKTGYCHHIERLMVFGNLMLLTEIDPNQVYRWFMELFIDSYDWVMVPNVYGMSQYADGGLITTKPYISSSNYILKMSDYPRGEWCQIWDALFWRFIGKNYQFFESNPRLCLMARQFDKISVDRKRDLFNVADKYLERLS